MNKAYLEYFLRLFIALACEVPDGLAFNAILSAKSYVKDLKDRGYNIVAVNASYGNYQANQAEFNSLQELSNSGILFCTASGNDGWNLEIEKDHNHNGIIDEGEDINGDGKLNVSYPNSYPLPNIIAVAATNKYRLLKLRINEWISQHLVQASILQWTEITEENHLISLGNDRAYGFELVEYSGRIPLNGLMVTSLIVALVLTWEIFRCGQWKHCSDSKIRNPFS